MPTEPKAPWYAAGLAFECRQCGRCCSGPEEGYVWCTLDEVAAMAAELRMPQRDMLRRYTRRVGAKLTLIEEPQTRNCILLDRHRQDDRLVGRCRVYQCRPRQCRTWPFWKSNLVSPQSWALAALRCPGMNWGRLFSYEQIAACLASEG
jgi:Fe-S-cluster containining protein